MRNGGVRMKASATIEATYIMPIIFLIYIVAIFLAFYYHDKIIISGICFETSIIAGQQSRIQETVEVQILEDYIYKESKEKLLLFPPGEVSIERQDNQVIVTIQLNHREITVFTKHQVNTKLPETILRKQEHRKELLDGNKSQ